MSGILDFLSEHSVAEHKEYLNNLRLRYSILLKSEERLSGLTPTGIRQRRDIPRELRREALEILCEIRLHETYFSSFGKCGAHLSILREHYGSESSFLYEALRASRDFGAGYMTFGCIRGVPIFSVERTAIAAYNDNAVLCIDLYEHAYFRDFGHKREEYLKAALMHLDLTRLSQISDLSD